MAIQGSLSGSLTVSDAIGSNTALAKILSGLSFTGTIFVYNPQVTITTGATPITLPASPAQLVYIKNTGGTNNLQVTWTPQGGASNIVINLTPGSAILLVEAAAGAGISALSIQASAGTTTVEYLIVA